jgi:hypothetical protein
MEFLLITRSFPVKTAEDHNIDCLAEMNVLAGPVYDIDNFGYISADKNEGNTAWILPKGAGGLY